MTDLFSYPTSPGFKEHTTSLEAAAAVASKAAAMREKVLSVFQTGARLTADEVASRLKESVLSIRPRVSELYADGKIVRTGGCRKNRSGNRTHVLVIAGGGQ
jgi:hypothetical protein